MHTRFDAGSDIATLGAWDAARDEEPLADATLSDATLGSDAERGHVFLIRMGGDGGGAVDVYVDEPIPADVAERLAPLDGELLLRLPTGSLIVDGAEYYRQRGASRTGGAASVPKGDYAVRCHRARDAEAEPASEAELRQKVGRAELDYYDRSNRRGCIAGVVVALVVAALTFALAWPVAGGLVSGANRLVLTGMVALTATLLALGGFFALRERFMKRDARYQRLDKEVAAHRLRGDPIFVLSLRRVTDSGGMKGGAVVATRVDV